MHIPFISTGELSPEQIVGAYAMVAGIWIAMAAMLGHSARIFVGAEDENLTHDTALAIMGGIIMIAFLRHFEWSIAEWIIQRVPNAYADLAAGAELAIASFVGASGLRLVLGLR